MDKEKIKIVIDIFKALSFIQVGYSDIDIIDDMTDEELREAVNEFEKDICSLETLDDHHESEYAVQYLHIKFDSVFDRLRRMEDNFGGNKDEKS